MTSAQKQRVTLEHATIRFAGDSGDGMQLTGTQFTATSALIGNDIATFPDFPAEIRAPAGTLAGVSSFQVRIGEVDIHTPGDTPDILVAMNPAALKVNISLISKGAMIVADAHSFTKRNLIRAGFETNPLEDDSLDAYQLVEVDITKLTLLALNELELDSRSKSRCKNFFALGMMYWLYNRPLDPTIEWIEKKFSKAPILVDANIRALKAGYNYSDTTDLMKTNYEVKPAAIEPGTYRSITGNQSLSWGLIAGSKQAGIPIFLGTYPITPASDILHELAKHKEYGVMTFQAEDEIAAICSAIGASFGGGLAVTSTSGPGLALKSEALGLAVKTELPLVVINVQRAGPSTGMPTKTEQSDLLQVMYGRNGESPLCVLSASQPGDCFDTAFEAVKIALEHMTPVVILSDIYIANGSAPWKIPDPEGLSDIQPRFANDPSEFLPYKRDTESLARQWAVPGMPGFEHRIGGLEGQNETGNVSYLPDNHETMSLIRQEKIDRIANTIPEQSVHGNQSGDLLVLSWGSTYGAVFTAVEKALQEGKSVAHAHLRYLNPLPRNLKSLLKQYKAILIPELNLGQLSKLLKQQFDFKLYTHHKIQGQPFKIEEIKARIDEVLKEEGSHE